MKDLFLCATPLQASIARAIALKLRSSDYDVIYSTRYDSPTDRRYADLLGKGSSSLSYLAGTPGRINIARQGRRLWSARGFLKRDIYNRIFLASLESRFFQIIAWCNPSAQIVTFDDGAANILSHSRLRNPGTRSSEFLFSKAGAKALRARIASHFSIYPGFPNIVDERLVQYVDLRSSFHSEGFGRRDETESFFIGQPYEDAIASGTLDNYGVRLIEKWLRETPPDHYLQHPRELNPLMSANDVERSDLMAEERLFLLSNGRRPIIYSWFSSVLFNIRPEQADKYYLSVGIGAKEEERRFLAKKAGCRIVNLRESAR